MKTPMIIIDDLSPLNISAETLKFFEDFIALMDEKGVKGAEAGAQLKEKLKGLEVPTLKLEDRSPYQNREQRRGRVDKNQHNREIRKKGLTNNYI